MHAVINLNKPKGITSQQAVSLVKRICRVSKAGHAGTLDPAATGILLVCTGEATKITRFLSDLDKEYVTLVKLGEKTDTYDSEGRVTEQFGPFSLTVDEIRKTLTRFTGTIEQVPPMFSAIKVAGEPLYKLARKGKVVERRKRSVTIHALDLLSYDPPFLRLRISCSKGTYIRSVCHDLGEALGIGAYMHDLKRTRIGELTIDDAIDPEVLEGLVSRYGESCFSGEAGVSGMQPRLKAFSTVGTALGHLRALTLNSSEYKKARNGLPFSHTDAALALGEYILLHDPSGNLFAVAEAAEGIIRIARMLLLPLAADQTTGR